jgi:hypothetical protein
LSIYGKSPKSDHIPSDPLERIKFLRQIRGGMARVQMPIDMSYEGVDTRVSKQIQIGLRGHLIQIENTDADMSGVDAEIALSEYDKTDYTHGELIEQFRGVMGERIIMELFKHEKIDNHYVSRELGYWTYNRDRIKKYDFISNEKTIEIFTVSPKGNNLYCTIHDSEWKKSDYAVCVKILWADCLFPFKHEWHLYRGDQDGEYENVYNKPIPKEEKTPYWIGDALVCGYEELEKILKWTYSTDGSPCYEDIPCYCQRIDRLKPIDSLLDILKSPKPKQESPA